MHVLVKTEIGIKTSLQSFCDQLLLYGSMNGKRDQKAP
jgi:hypothetical protein